MKQFSCDRCGTTKDLEEIGAGTLCFSCQNLAERQARQEQEIKDHLLSLARKAAIPLNQSIPYSYPGIGEIELDGKCYQVRVFLEPKR